MDNQFDNQFLSKRYIKRMPFSRLNEFLFAFGSISFGKKIFPESRFIFWSILWFIILLIEARSWPLNGRIFKWKIGLVRYSNEWPFAVSHSFSLKGVSFSTNNYHNQINWIEAAWIIHHCLVFSGRFEFQIQEPLEVLRGVQLLDTKIIWKESLVRALNKL